MFLTIPITIWGLFSFTTPKHQINKIPSSLNGRNDFHKEKTNPFFSCTKWCVVVIVSQDATIIIFFPCADITGQIEGVDYVCNISSNICTVETTANSTVTYNADGSITVTNPLITYGSYQNRN